MPKFLRCECGGKLGHSELPICSIVQSHSNISNNTGIHLTGKTVFFRHLTYNYILTPNYGQCRAANSLNCMGCPQCTILMKKNKWMQFLVFYLNVSSNYKSLIRISMAAHSFNTYHSMFETTNKKFTYLYQMPWSSSRQWKKRAYAIHTLSAPKWSDMKLWSKSQFMSLPFSLYLSIML